MTTELHIIIAEDDKDDCEIIRDAFEQHVAYLKVDVVGNGVELLQLLNDGQKKPDVILTDLNMPIMSGIEALKEIYDNTKLRSIPTFVYSTTINPIYEAKCRELGIRGFLIKPYMLEEFREIPKKIIEILNRNL
jgi:CheY-like chemotaxis protein